MSHTFLVMDPIASDARLAAATAHRYVTLLEQAFLAKRLPTWSRNIGTRATATPKIFFVDSGIAIVEGPLCLPSSRNANAGRNGG